MKRSMLPLWSWREDRIREVKFPTNWQVVKVMIKWKKEKKWVVGELLFQIANYRGMIPYIVNTQKNLLFTSNHFMTSFRFHKLMIQHLNTELNTSETTTIMPPSVQFDNKFHRSTTISTAFTKWNLQGYFQ